jgi:hypothetical protein
MESLPLFHVHSDMHTAGLQKFALVQKDERWARAPLI